jgi:hypothetical protein
MRRADIARVSAVSGGADYIFTLLDQRARGRRVVAAVDLSVLDRTRHLGHVGLSRYGVIESVTYLLVY